MPSPSCYPDKAPVIDKLMTTLSNHLRREVINYFENCVERETTQLSELVAHIDERVPESTDEIRIQLYHTHLPKLDDRDWLDYSIRTGRIQYHGHRKAESLTGEVHDIF